MGIVPEILADLDPSSGEALNQRISTWLYQQVVERAPRHLLVRIHQRFVFDSLEASCRDFHHQRGPGAPPTHPVPQLVRVLLVKYLYGWSLRETELHLQSDLLLRWFVGYTVLERVVDHSQLERFDQWVERYHPRLFFDTVLAQIDRDFPQQRVAVQIGDTFAMQANAVREDLVTLLRHTSRVLLRELEQGATGHAQTIWSKLAGAKLFGAADEKRPYHLTQSERQEQKENTVRGVGQLLQLLEPLLKQLAEPLRTRVQIRVEDLHKILQDEFRLQYDASGQIEQVTEREPKDKGEYRLISATDREATCRNHAGAHTDGYNISLAATPQGIIREIQSATGAEPDQAGVARLIAAQQEHQGNCPPRLIYDQAAGAGRTRAEVERVSGGQTQLVARIPPPSTSGRYRPEDFHFDEEGALVCPAERRTTSHYRSGQRDAWHYEFAAKSCQGCPLWQQCRAPASRPDGARRVHISDYQEQVRQAQLYNQTQAFRADMKLRPLIERIIFMLTHFNGARRAWKRGQQGTDFQVKMCAAARNLRTWLQLHDLLVVEKRHLGVASA